jgi:hypothetical protein
MNRGRVVGGHQRGMRTALSVPMQTQSLEKGRPLSCGVSAAKLRYGN